MKGLFRKTRSNEWVTIEVNLRRSQYELLSRLADELDISTSRVTRRILEQFLAESSQANDRSVQQESPKEDPAEAGGFESITRLL